MYVKGKISTEQYKDIACLMRSFMCLWKNKEGKILKEISMPDMIDILCRHKYTDFDSRSIINEYWKQLKEIPDKEISNQIYCIIRNNIETATQLYGFEGFTKYELQNIINEYIKDIPVFIKEEQ